MIKSSALLACAAALSLLCASAAFAQAAVEKAPYDAALAKSVGADDNGMRAYVLVVLKTGPNKVPAGPERDAMFKGHFANMGRLSAEGKLALAGPFDGVDGWRGLFILAVPNIEEAKQITATDPVIASGEMVAEFHKYYGSAALMLVRHEHDKVTKLRR
ncbi:MAG: YciI family protein [Pseudomonadota bacterium]